MMKGLQYQRKVRGRKWIHSAADCRRWRAAGGETGSKRWGPRLPVGACLYWTTKPISSTQQLRSWTSNTRLPLEENVCLLVQFCCDSCDLRSSTCFTVDQLGDQSLWLHQRSQKLLTVLVLSVGFAHKMQHLFSCQEPVELKAAC